MIPDIGLMELLVIAALAIIVVGPKDLPRLMRILGRWLSKARAMAREFQKSFDDIAREAELDELRKEVESLKDANPIDAVKKELDFSDDLAEIDQDLKEAIDTAHNPPAADSSPSSDRSPGKPEGTS